METIHRKPAAEGAGAAAGGVTAHKELECLRGVACLGRLWLETMPPASAERAAVMHMNAMVDEMVRRGDDSPDALVAVRAMLCLNCRRLGAARGKCFGAPLLRCALLNALNQ